MQVRVRAIQGVEFPCVQSRADPPLSTEERSLLELLPSAIRDQCVRLFGLGCREFKLPWREAGPPNHHNDKVDSDS